MPHPNIAELEARIDGYEEAIATFARLHEELTELRDSVTLPEACSRLEVMLQLNAETLHAIKQSLALALAALKRAQRPLALAAAGK